MRTPSKHNCLTCLLSVQGMQHTLDAELQRLLMQHLNWQLEELSEDFVPQQMCKECHQQLLQFERFQQQAIECRQLLLQYKTMASFEIVYQKQEAEQEERQEEQAAEAEQEQEQLNEGVANMNPDPFEEQTQVAEAAELPVEQQQKETKEKKIGGEAEQRRRRCKGLKNSYKCAQCGHCFAHSLTLSAHVRKVHEGSKRPFQCDRCEKSYSFMGGLYTHIKEIHGPQQTRSYTCDQAGCERVYISYIAMQKHKRLKHTNPSAATPLRKYVCEECGATFNQTANLKYHRRTKHPTAAEAAENARNSEQHYCMICQKHFHSRYTLKYHTMQQHTESAGLQEGGIECQVCGRRMAKRFMLVQHMLMHSADKMPCEHCGRLFARKFELEAHIRAVHLKLKPFTCKYCAESFASRKTLRHHEYIHTGEKPYVCHICGQAFRQQTCLKNHGKVHDKLPSSTKS